jgi:thiol-disulfide isomerase/thioredoxin
MKVVALVVLLAAATASADDAPPIDEAITKAARENKLLVLELGAAWCKPCVWFEQNVLPDPRVAAEIAKIAFVRYDVDTPIGNEAATRYRVNGFPTFIVLDAKGAETFRVSGLPGRAAAVPWFLQLIRTGHSAQSPLEQLRAAVNTRANDLSLRLELAHALRLAGQDDDAKAEYAAVLTAESVDPIATAEAEAALEDMEAARRRIAAAVSDAASFIAKYPGSPLSSQKLALIVMARGMDMTALDRALAAHLAAVRPVDRPGALRVALIARRSQLARSAFESWTDLDPTSASLMGAELALEANKRDDAKRLVATACKDTPAGFERWCLDLVGTVRGGIALAPVERMRTEAIEMLSDLRAPGAHEMSLDRIDAEAGNAVARALLVADRRCAQHAVKKAGVIVSVKLSPHGGTPRGVDVIPEDNKALATCIRRTLLETRYPAVASDAQTVKTALVLEGAQRNFGGASEPSPEIDAGAVIGLAGRLGAVDSTSFAIDALFDVTRLSSFRLVTSFALEGGMAKSRDTEKLDAVYAARGLVGAGYAPSPNVVVELAVGIGASKYGPDMPVAFEIPSEVRVRVARGSARFHAWARATYFLGSTSRDPETSFALASSDEMALGIAVAGPLFDKEVFSGLVFEDREVGKNALLVIGIPIGGFF